jgi:transposase
MTTLADDLVPDQLWALVAPLLPAPPRPPYGGRHRTISDRACLAAILYMARTSTPWRLLPARELGCGSPATCWRRLTEWANAGVFDQLHLQVLDRLGEQGRLDWSRASVDTRSGRAKRGGPGGRKSRRSWPAWKQAPPGLRRWRGAAECCGDRGQRQRHHHVPGGRGRRATDPHPVGTAPYQARQGPRGQGGAPRGAVGPGGVKDPPLGCRSSPAEAEGSPAWEAPGRVGAALTTTGRVGTARRPGSGKQGRTVQRRVNQWWNPRKRQSRLEPGGCGPVSSARRHR